jgi:hypothetical protein
MEIKSTYDTRGRQRNVLRLAHFDREGLAHILSYRVLAFLTIITGIVVLYAILSGNSAWMTAAKILIGIVWLLFGIELYSVYKAFGIIATKGIVFGRLNESFLNSEVRMKRWYGLIRAAGPVLIIVWYALFAVFALVVII